MIVWWVAEGVNEDGAFAERMMRKMVADRFRFPLAPMFLLLLGTVLRVCYIRHANPVEGDPLLYGNIARNLLEHGVYSFSPATAVRPSPTLIRLPGYPLFLALVFRVFGIFNFAAVRAVQLVLDLVGCLFLAALARLLFGRRAGLLALGLSALCPFVANYVAAPLTETLTLLAISVSFWALEHWRRATAQEGSAWNGYLAWIGGALAVSVLLRPEQGLLCAVVMLAMAAVRVGSGSPMQRLAPVLVVALMVVLPLLPWAWRNWRTFHVVQPLAPHYATDPGEPVPLGFQRWFRSWAIDFASTEEVYWNYDGSPILVSDLPERAFDSEGQRRATAKLLKDYNETVTPTAELDDRFERLARERIRSHEGRYFVWLPMARLGNMLLRPRTELMNTQLAWWDWRGNLGQAIFALGYAMLNAGYLIAGVTGAVWWWRTGERSSRPLLLAFAAFVALRCALLLTLDNSEPRYTLEFFPLLIVAATAMLQPRAVRRRI